MRKDPSTSLSLRSRMTNSRVGLTDGETSEIKFQGIQPIHSTTKDIHMKKLTAFILAAVMIFALAACGGKDSPAVLTYGETVITEAMYNYYVSTYKGRYIQSYDDIRQRGAESCCRRGVPPCGTVPICGSEDRC